MVSIDARQKITEGDEGFSRALWAQFAEMGWLGLPFSEEDGGFGGTAVETMILLEAFGQRFGWLNLISQRFYRPA